MAEFQNGAMGGGQERWKGAVEPVPHEHSMTRKKREKKKEKMNRSAWFKSRCEGDRTGSKEGSSTQFRLGWFPTARFQLRFWDTKSVIYNMRMFGKGNLSLHGSKRSYERNLRGDGAEKPGLYERSRGPNDTHQHKYKKE